MDQKVRYLLLVFIIIEQVLNVQTENDLSLFRYRREALYKTSQVLNCIRRLRSIIIKPSKLDFSTEMLNCLQQVKTPKSNKQNKKT